MGHPGPLTPNVGEHECHGIHQQSIAHPCAERQPWDKWAASLTVDGFRDLFHRTDPNANSRVPRNALIANGEQETEKIW